MQNYKVWLLEKSLETIIKNYGDKVDEKFITKLYKALDEIHVKATNYVEPLLNMKRKDENFNFNDVVDSIDKMMKNTIKVDLGKFKTSKELKTFIDEAVAAKGVNKADIIKAYNPYDSNDPEHNKIVEIPKEGTSIFPLQFKAGNWRVYEPKSLKATTEFTPMKYLGWCTAGSQHYCHSYSTENGRLFVFLNGNKFYGQLFVNKNGNTEFMKPAKNPTASGPAAQEPLDLDEFYQKHSELQEFLKSVGYKEYQGFKFNGRKFDYTTETEDGKEILVFKSIDVSDMGLTSLMDLPWNKPPYV